MVARLRHMREQRERQEGRKSSAGRPVRAPSNDDGADAARFHPGDQIVCTPYGRGEVIESSIEDDRELLVVHFPAHGRLTIDASVSAARLADEDGPAAQAEE